ncbi:MAG: fructose-bisphosphatase class II [Zetaproteobacteria bacterium]|nr:fructose-bisphosphatase class II [Pseudobdellovibrionaceae bacterium]
MNRNFALEFVRVSEAAALASARWMGRGEKNSADRAAVEAMRKAFDTIDFHGVVKIGEGERDKAPMLYIGEKVGKGLCSGSKKLDLALDPLEGTSICASGGMNALSVIAIAEEGNFLHAPDVYMEKIAVGPKAVGAVSLQNTVAQNLHNVAEAKRCSIKDLTVVVLDRPRHEKIISEIRELGARIWLIGDGDVQAAIATAMEQSGVDILMGVGGAPEGVISAAALKCIGGDFCGRLVFHNEDSRSRALLMGIKDLNRNYSIDDLAAGNVMFCATGVTDGSLLKGVKFFGGGARTHSLVMRSETGTVRFIETSHNFEKKPNYNFI